MAKEITKHYYNQTDNQKVKIKSAWWNEDEKDLHHHMFGVYKQIKQNQSYRFQNNAKFLRLYSNQALNGMSAAFMDGGLNNIKPNRMTFNVIKSCIDTASAKIAKTKPKPFFLTDGNSWDLQERAKALNQYMLGMFRSMGTGFGPDRSLYSVGRETFNDALIFGTGATRFFVNEDKEIKAERNIIDEIIVDDYEGMYRAPRSPFRRKFVFRDVLKDLYPKKADLIDATPSAFTGQASSRTSADMVELLEGWHLRTSKNTKDGCYGIALENCTLDKLTYDRDYFPFLFQRWSLLPIGFFGQGLSEELIGIQLEISKILRVMQIAQHLMATPQVWLESTSKAVTKQLNNEIGGLHYYRGRPPVFMTPQAMNAEMYNHLENLVRKAYEITGISLLSAQSKKPSGLDAAVALREYQDIESERFSIASLMYEDWYMDATQIIMLEARALLKEKGFDTVVRVKDGNLMRELRFSEVDIPDDKLMITPYPTNILPATPTGKLQTVQEMTQSGFFDKEEAFELLDYPDINKVKNLKGSQRNWVIKTIEHMIRTGEYMPPEPFQNFDLTLSLTQSYYALGKTQNMPEEKLTLLRTYMKDTETLKQKAAPSPMENPTMDQPAQAPLAVPEPLPTNELLPVA